MTDTNIYTWIPFYQELADKLLQYKNNRSALISIIKNKLYPLYTKMGLSLPKLDRGEPTDIDPFTFFGLFNRGIKDENRISLIQEVKKEFDIVSEIPSNFLGIPLVYNRRANFYYFIGDREEHDIDNLWNLFESALNYTATNSNEDKEIVISNYNKVINQKGASWNITMGLYWIRPYNYINLDSSTRNALNNSKMIPPVDSNVIPLIKALPSGEKYFSIIDMCKEYCKNNNLDFPALSYKAWLYNKQNNKWWPSLDEFNPNLSKNDWKKYILEFEKPNHPVTIQMLKAMLELNGEASCKTLADKFGGTPSAYVGCAVNLGKRVKNYFNLPACMDGNKERYFPFPFFGKDDDKYYVYKIRPELMEALNEIDLTDVSPYYRTFENDIDSPEKKQPIENQNTYDSYNKEQFLDEVYMDDERYNTLVRLLDKKMNIILQGAPGVGKTFAARRLAWSIMGEKDNNRIEFVQFHQNYSYEDFIMGYKPFENGFRLENGIFYDFCIKAKNDPDKKYFFIIDEINRGNMSKIFGELLMLIESDYRKEEVKLAYSKQPFSIPQNLYIIGMMNTADRSLAMIDYALRRRFSFVEMTPGFDSEGFKNYQTEINNATFDKLIEKIKVLNTTITDDPSLGKGFCVGHSYFCNLVENSDDTILKEIVDYDIAPMLEEYWFDDKEKCDSEINKLRGLFK